MLLVLTLLCVTKPLTEVATDKDEAPLHVCRSTEVLTMSEWNEHISRGWAAAQVEEVEPR